MSSQARVAGLVRSPDHEGALAHLDVDRGFALVARGSASVTDVIDPAIWVKEKLSVALAAPLGSGETPLGKLLAALRSVHTELMRRPQRDRAWVSVMAARFVGGDGVLVSSGDCACLRYRDGALSRLRPPSEEGLVGGPPKGALGSEPQVRIEVVTLNPRPGDLYVVSTRQLRDGELAALADGLGAARDGAELLRAGVEGASDRGRIVIRVLEAEEDATLVERAEALQSAGRGSLPEGATDEAIEHLPLLRDDALQPQPDASHAPSLAAGVPEYPPGLPGAVLHETSENAAPTTAVAAPAAEGTPGGTAEGTPQDLAVATTGAFPGDIVEHPPRQELAPVEEKSPWYELLALWGGGALAIIALALLIKSILPGIFNHDAPKNPAAAATTASALVDFASDPSGAAVRVDGEPLDGKTPLTGVALEPGSHRVELDWGPAGVWRDTIEVTAGSPRIQVMSAIYGTVSLRSSDPARTLDVYVDGAFAGTTPLTIDHVVVGRHLVRFGGPGTNGTTQSVDVLRDTRVEVVGNAGPLPTTGRLTIRSALLTDAGFEAGRSDPVWIDGTARGATPFSLPLKPGSHSVRVVRRGFPAQVSVVDVKPGGEHYVTAEFGGRSEQPLQLTPPDAISISSPLPVTVALPVEEWDPTMALWLYAAAPEGSFQAKRMTKIEGGDRVFATLIPPEVLRNSARRVRVYCKAVSNAGRELYSEIFTIQVRD